tara:strand:- start:6 stop:374 length:369 start_codon:yes stop_codon:yes gene_type:complete
MPVYPVRNTKTGEQKDINMTIANYQQWRKENPDWDRDWTDPANFPYIGKYPRSALISDAIAGPTQAVDIVKELEAPGTERRLQEKDLGRTTKGYAGMISPIDKNFDKGSDSSTFKAPDRVSK